jgi:serine/threonine protein kinase
MVRPRPGDPPNVGQYRILGRLGEGAMGQVYLACSPGGRLVAVKTIRSPLAAHEGFRARFRSELAAARRVSGVYTAAVVDADLDAPVPWIATAYIPAPSLEDLVDHCGPLSPAGVAWLGAACAEALDAIHRAGLVHRDIKPSNVLVCVEGARIVDFGLARTAEAPRLTQPGILVGTPTFMAPEQADGLGPVGPPADIFALGATLVFAATGHGPYHALSNGGVLAQRAVGLPDLKGLPSVLHEVVEACLAQDPAARPDPLEVLERLSDLLPDDPRRPPLSVEAWRMIGDYAAVLPVQGRQGSGPGSGPGSNPSWAPEADADALAALPPLPRRRRRYRSSAHVSPVTAAVSAGVLLAAGAGMGWLFSDHRPPPPPPGAPGGPLLSGQPGYYGNGQPGPSGGQPPNNGQPPPSNGQPPPR